MVGMARFIQLWRLVVGGGRTKKGQVITVKGGALRTVMLYGIALPSFPGDGDCDGIDHGQGLFMVGWCTSGGRCTVRVHDE